MEEKDTINSMYNIHGWDLWCMHNIMGGERKSIGKTLNDVGGILEEGSTVEMLLQWWEMVRQRKEGIPSLREHILKRTKDLRENWHIKIFVGC